LNEELGSENRPNKNYELSKPDSALSPDEGITFHYNRERRLANAPKEVQDLYREQKKSRFGLFGSLVADKPRRMLFAIIILLCLAIFMLSRLGYFETTYTLDGNRIDIKGTAFEGTTIITLKKIAKNADAFTGAVDIAVSPVVRNEDEQYLVFSHRVFFSLEKEEEYRFAAPFDDGELLMVLQNEKSTLQLVIKPE